MTDDLAARLLEAQVAYTKEQLLDPANFAALVTDEVEHVLSDASELTLDDAVTRQMIKDTAHKYAVSMPVEGAIPELAGEIAARLYRHPVQERARVTDIIDERRFDDIASSVAQLEVSRRIVRRILDSPVTVDACVEVIAHALDTAVADGRAHADGAGLRSRIVGALARVVGPAVPAVEVGVEKLARSGATYVLHAAGTDPDEAILAAAREIWRANADGTVGGFRDFVTPDDVEDFVVVVVEFWKSFRDTDYFRALLDEGIDHFFDKYGDVPLTDLLADLGIGRADLIEEGLRFGPPVLTRLDEHGVVDDALRRRLAPFFDSPHFRAAVSDTRR